MVFKFSFFFLAVAQSATRVRSDVKNNLIETDIFFESQVNNLPKSSLLHGT